MQEWLDAEVPLLSKTGCLAQSLRGACAILAQKKCKILPGLVAAKTEPHMAMPHMSGTAGSMMRDRLVRRGLLQGKLQPDSCKQSRRQEAHASYAILDFKSIRIHVRIHVRIQVRMITYACVHSLARSLRQKKNPLRETGAMQCFYCVSQYVEHTCGHPNTTT